MASPLRLGGSAGTRWKLHLPGKRVHGAHAVAWHVATATPSRSRKVPRAPMRCRVRKDRQDRLAVFAKAMTRPLRISTPWGPDAANSTCSPLRSRHRPVAVGELESAAAVSIASSYAMRAHSRCAASKAHRRLRLNQAARRSTRDVVAGASGSDRRRVSSARNTGSLHTSMSVAYTACPQSAATCSIGGGTAWRATSARRVELIRTMLRSRSSAQRSRSSQSVHQRTSARATDPALC